MPQQMSAQEIAIELQRKKAAGVTKASDPANQAALDKLWAQPASGAQAASTQDYGTGVRKFFNDAGYTDIGYDNKSNSVLVNGQSVLNPSKVVNGTSYASNDDLTKALVGLQNRESNKKVQGYMGQLETAMNTPYKAPEFNYSVETDPQYIAALSRAKANSETASGNAMAELNKRGILNSTITSDRLGQIQQAEYGKVSDELVPQLMQQAYSRYRDTVGDDYRSSRDKVGDLANILGIESNVNQNRITNYNADRDYAHTIAREAITDKQYQQTFDYNVKHDGLVMALEKAKLDHQISNDAAQNAISSMNAATSRMSAGTSASALAWSKDPNNPDNLYKVAQTTALNDKTPKVDSNSVFSEATSNMDRMTNEQRKNFLNGEKTDIIKKLGISGYNQLYNMYFDKDGDPLN